VNNKTERKLWYHLCFSFKTFATWCISNTTFSNWFKM